MKNIKLSSWRLCLAVREHVGPLIPFVLQWGWRAKVALIKTSQVLLFEVRVRPSSLCQGCSLERQADFMSGGSALLDKEEGVVPPVWERQRICLPHDTDIHNYITLVGGGSCADSGPCAERHIHTCHVDPRAWFDAKNWTSPHHLSACTLAGFDKDSLAQNKVCPLFPRVLIGALSTVLPSSIWDSCQIVRLQHHSHWVTTVFTVSN